MPGGLLPLVQRRTRPPLALGVLVAVLCVVAETLLADLLEQITPVRSLGILYLLGIVIVASVWGLWLGMATALVSTVALDYFLIPPTGSLTLDKAEDWTVFAVFVAVTLLAGSISKLARSLAAEADARKEADLSAELARILLRAPDLKTARPAAERYLARTLKLPSAAIRLGPIPDDGHRVAFPLHDDGVQIGALIVPSDLPRPAMRRLRDRVVPSMEVLLQAARERQRTADEQAALRRLATLVAHGAPPSEVFSAVAREVGQILQAPHTAVIRYEPDATATTVGVWNSGLTPLGSRWPLEKGSPTELVARTRAPGRVDGIQTTAGNGELLATLRAMGITSTLGCPITVGGRLWGAVFAASTSEPLPDNSEKRMLDFTDLLVASIANAEDHRKLEASRARVVAAADATRRFIERDLHDGTQQHLVALMLHLRTVESTLPAGLREFKGLLSHAVRTLDEALEDLRGIARGLLPALLSRAGLEPALRALARCSAVPVELNLRGGELTERFEVTAYYVVAEALTNAAEHADAAVVRVDLVVKEATVRLSVRDDGKGGADPERGSGLISIKDRVEALGGSLEITSPVGGGTSLLAEIPITDG
jgi:signal transduction histidine kinase